MRPGVKLLLPAFERAHDERGVPDMQRTAFHVPDAYARDTAKRHAAYFEWAASIHPYRRDAVEALQKAKGEDYPLPGDADLLGGLSDLAQAACAEHGSPVAGEGCTIRCCSISSASGSCAPIARRSPRACSRRGGSSRAPCKMIRSCRETASARSTA